MLSDLSSKPRMRLTSTEKIRFGLFRLSGGLERMRLTALNMAGWASEIATNPSPALLDAPDQDGPAHYGYQLRRAFTEAIESSYESSLRLRLCAAAVAIERFRLDHDGALPQSVDELYPLYLKTIPVDPVTGVPLIIDPADGEYTIRAKSDQYYFDIGALEIENARITIKR